MAQGNLVCILEVSSDGQTTRRTGDPYAQGLDQLVDIHGGSLALQVGVRSQDHLLDVTAAKAAQEAAPPVTVRKPWPLAPTPASEETREETAPKFWDTPGPAMILAKVEPGNVEGIGRVTVAPEDLAVRFRAAATNAGTAS